MSTLAVHASPRRPYEVLYTRYERLWHWGQAVAIIALLLLGLEIHSPHSFHIIGFKSAVLWHNLLGFLLIIHGFLATFYHLTTGMMRQFIPEPRDFFSMAIEQVRFYMGGIFRGAPHPFEHSRANKLNPLQKVTYLMILVVLLPAQVVSGFLLWGAQRWPEFVESLGGLRPLAGIHSLGAWMFAAFIIMHVYLTTTGDSPLANIKAMLVGHNGGHTGTGHAPEAAGESALDFSI